MLATLNILTNPFNPNLDRKQVALTRRVKIKTLVKQHKINLNKPVICYYNGEYLLRQEWERTYIKNNDVVAFIYLPQGGGGSNPLKLILMIAISVYAPVLATAISGATSGLAFQVLSAGIGLLGNTLVNALIPPPQPPKGQQQAQLASPSPTYSISAQGNQARLGQPIPVLYGRMKVYPDFAAQPYAEYESNEQYLYQLFCITQGKAVFDSTEIFIEDTPITSYGSDFEFEIVPPNTGSTLYPTDVYNVSEVSGQELDGLSSIGPFTVSAPLTSTNRLSFDIALPRGLGYINDEGSIDAIGVTFRFQAERIDDSGNVISSFILGTETITAATNNAIRRTYKYDVTPGRYRVGASRIGTKSTAGRYLNDLIWTGAKGYSAITRQYGNVTLLAMKIKATNNISSQSSRKVNVIARRQLPIPQLNATSDGYDWSIPQETQSIAWAIADMCRAAYGAGVTEARFNVAQLMALNTILTTRGDKLNCIFDSSQTFWEALSIACRTGRIRPYVQGGIIHFVRDSAQSLPTAMFTSRNIVKGSFKLTYISASEDNADSVDVEYFDENLWRPRVVKANLDVSESLKPAKVKAFGITNRSQAFKEGMYIAASNRFRRKEISFETELEGHIPSLGDLIAIQSDIPEWGQSGEVVEKTTGRIVSSEPFEWTPAVNHFIMLRKTNGSGSAVIPVTQGESPNVLLFLDSLLTFPINTDISSGERTFISFGREGSVIQLARVLSTVPRSNTVQITAINEDARVHTADGTTIPLDTYQWSLTAPKIRPVLTDFTVSQTGSGTNPTVLASWAPTAGASKYLLEISSDNENWATLAEITGTSYSFVANQGLVYIRAAAYGGVIGPFITKTINIGLIPPPPNVISGSVSANGQSYDVSWAPVVDCDGYYIEVANAGSVKRVINTISTNFSYTLENAIADGGPWRTIQIRIKATKGQVRSENFLILNGTNAAPAAPTLILNPGSESVAITVSNSTDTDYAGTMIYASAVDGFTPSEANKIYEGNSNFFLHVGITGQYFYRAVHFDTYGKDGLNFSTQYSAIPSASSGGIEVVGSLPTTGNFEGRTVYLTVDDTLYTYDADTSTWNPAGSTPDGSITYEKLAPGLNFQALIESGEIIADNISAGAITTPKIATNAITAEKVSAGAITATKINVANLSAINANMGSITAGNITLDNLGFIKGGQTAYSVGTGFFLGNHLGQYVMSVGNSEKGFSWNGANFTIKGDLTAGSININNKFIVDSNGNVTIKSSLGGARIEQTNDVIKVFDQNGTLRVKLGNLLA